jgi:hypothetical protein
MTGSEQIRDILAAQSKGGSTVFVEPESSASVLPEKPTEVSRDGFAAAWRRTFHRIRFLYQVVKLLRALGALGFTTWNEAQDSEALKELRSQVMPEVYGSDKESEEEAKADVFSMEERSEEEMSEIGIRPLQNEAIRRLEELCQANESTSQAYQHFSTRYFFRQHQNAGYFARRWKEEAKAIERDLKRVQERLAQFGTKDC